MITTRESINYQFSLIFGYSSPNDFTAGNVIGPGKLTREKVNQLSEDVIKFLGMYNAILRDYTGSEVFSIEFQLYNHDEKDAQLNIYPKSMILIPGRYKDCESLLLALKAETGYLDTHKAKKSVDEISRLFLEVEEFTDHPELGRDGKIKVINNFANRFSKKLYGELIEDKWNKKLIGISYSLPTEKEMLESYASIKNDINFKWNKRPIEISLSNHEFKRLNLPYEGQSEIEHLKYLISESSANFIVEKTLALGSDLLRLANTGTIDEIQDGIINFLLRQINQKLYSINEMITGREIIDGIKSILTNFYSLFERINRLSKEFESSGEIGTISELLETYNNYLKTHLQEEDLIIEEISDLVCKSIRISVTKEDNSRASELNSAFNYFFEISKMSITLIMNSLPRFLTRRRLKTLINTLINSLKERFNNEQKPSKILGYRILDRFESFLLSQIEVDPIILTKSNIFNEDHIIKEFKKIVIKNMKAFFNNLVLNISDLIGFAEIQMEMDANLIKSHLDKFEKFTSELKFLSTYILRYSTINRFLKDEPSPEIADPVTFSNRFHRFLEKRFGGIDLAWKEYILSWILDYAKKFFNIEEKRIWSLKETVMDFMAYFKDRESSETTSEHFLLFLDNYITKFRESEKSYLVDFYKKLEHSIEIKREFPKYIQNVIEKELTLFIDSKERLRPFDYFNSEGSCILYDFLSETELQYFSKLIPRPVSIILKHSLTDEEKKLFTNDLYHVLNFKYWYNKSIYEISDNYKEVYREWLRNTG